MSPPPIRTEEQRAGTALGTEARKSAAGATYLAKSVPLADKPGLFLRSFVSNS